MNKSTLFIQTDTATGHGSNLAVAVLVALCIDLNLINKMNGRRREAALAEPQRRTSLAAEGLVRCDYLERAYRALQLQLRLRLHTIILIIHYYLLSLLDYLWKTCSARCARPCQQRTTME